MKRSELYFSLTFLLMLIIAIGAFFYGVKVGNEKTESKYAAEAEPKSATASPLPNAYQQQDLVSFYHTVFLPYREFQNAWFEERTLWLNDSTIDRSGSLKTLAKNAKKKYEAVRKAYVAPSSPLLMDAQTNYLKSLKLFEDGFSSLVSTSNEGTVADLMDSLDKNTFYKEAQLQALTGQDRYYSAMLKWGATVNLDIPSEYTAPKSIALAQWNKLPLIIKNKVVADYLFAGRVYSPYLPHDLTARIDQVIRSGQAEKLKLKTVGSIAELLNGTDAVRSGDFLGLKSRLYDEPLLPLLPFFSPDK
ncbi:hypothetical protein ACFPVX_01040 [Cohnella faecalis]|uniref:hypothetical protein n=1 Tax=Cohnella faecalis TaxID=2315694 RepID=UPI001F245CDE|nr:hypothetical protein [Cohnella faecalis]